MPTFAELLDELKASPSDPGGLVAFAGAAFYMWVLGRRRRELLDLLEARGRWLDENTPRGAG